MTDTSHPPAQHAAAGYGANVRRPRTVTSAVVIGFGLAWLIFFSHLAFFFDGVRYIGANYGVEVAASGAGFAAIATAYFLVGTALSALLVWAAVGAFKGRTGMILLVVSMLTASYYAFGAAGMLTGFSGVGGEGRVLDLVHVLLVLTILMLISLPSSRAFFRARGAATTT